MSLLKNLLTPVHHLQRQAKRVGCLKRGHEWQGVENSSHDEQGRHLRFICMRCGAMGRLSLGGGIETCNLNDPSHSYGEVAAHQMRHMGQMVAVRAYLDAEPFVKERIYRKWLAPQSSESEAMGSRPVAEIIKNEEQRYVSLLRRAPEIARHWVDDPSRPTEGELVGLWDREGIDPEMALSALGLSCNQETVEAVTHSAPHQETP